MNLEQSVSRDSSEFFSLFYGPTEEIDKFGHGATFITKAPYTKVAECFQAINTNVYWVWIDLTL